MNESATRTQSAFGIRGCADTVLSAAVPREFLKRLPNQTREQAQGGSACVFGSSRRHAHIRRTVPEARRLLSNPGMHVLYANYS